MKTLFDKKRFTWQEEARIKELKGLSFEKAGEVQAELILFWKDLKNSFRNDNPVSYRILLRKRNESHRGL